MGRGISRKTVIDGLLACGATPYRRETLESMGPETLAFTVNAADVTPDELVRATEEGDVEARAILEREDGGDGEGPEVTGVLADPPESDPGADPSGDLAVLEEPGDEELGFEIRNVLDGPRGEAVVDEDGPSLDREDDDAGDLGFEVGGVLQD